jgi:hypothetical protein
MPCAKRGSAECWTVCGKCIPDKDQLLDQLLEATEEALEVLKPWYLYGKVQSPIDAIKALRKLHGEVREIKKELSV